MHGIHDQLPPFAPLLEEFDGIIIIIIIITNIIIIIIIIINNNNIIGMIFVVF